MKTNTEHWDKEVQEQFCKYVTSKDSDEKNKIYKDYLHEPLTKIVHSECERFGKKIKFHTSDKRDNLETDALTKLVKLMGSYNIKKAIENGKKGFSPYANVYCRIIVRSYLAGVYKREYTKNVRFEEFNEDQ
jgi:hypothetical protein